MIEFRRPDGGTAPGYLAHASDSAPGVVMLEEWWGVTDHIIDSAQRLSQSGYNVLVPDLYRGRKAATGDEANHLMNGLDFKDAATQDAAGAMQYLRDHRSKRVAVMGFCMGGALAVLAAMYVKGFDAASIWYGFPPPEAGDPSTISIPLQGHWALHDGFFPIGRVDEIEKALKEKNATYEFYRYDAEHGFGNPNPENQAGLGHYNKEATEQAWTRTLDFLKKTLQ